MDTAEKKRVEKAWAECKDWITGFDGSPTLALLVDVPLEGLVTSLQAALAGAENARITSIAAGHVDAPAFISFDELPAHLALLQEKKLAELSVNWAVRQEAFDLDIHLVIFLTSPEKAALEFTFWNDQVFSEETENPAQFAALAAYFIELQKLFKAGSLFVSPESGGGPTFDSDAWVEI